MEEGVLSEMKEGVSDVLSHVSTVRIPLDIRFNFDGRETYSG